MLKSAPDPAPGHTPASTKECNGIALVNINEFRKEYPGYDDLTDSQLAHALHAKYFKDISFNEFAKRFGVKED